MSAGRACRKLSCDPDYICFEQQHEEEPHNVRFLNSTNGRLKIVDTFRLTSLVAG
ncbi:MAG: hypothetical protein ACI9OJ_004641, partial [Myxococcota bacterium]